ncbi:hypothetical protein B0H12DRAFT_1126892 [Mycena haematopus]|nr:hypothetical protein B0H12DRAFT_1126892 [Mycena haematopus]
MSESLSAIIWLVLILAFCIWNVLRTRWLRHSLPNPSPCLSRLQSARRLQSGSLPPSFSCAHYPVLLRRMLQRGGACTRRFPLNIF